MSRKPESRHRHDSGERSALQTASPLGLTVPPADASTPLTRRYRRTTSGRDPRPGGRLLTVVPETREAPALGSVSVAAPSVGAKWGATLGVGLTGRVVPGVALMGCQGTGVRLPRAFPAVVYLYPGADWSPDGGSRSRIEDAVEHHAFERLVMDFFWRRIMVLGVSSECAQAQRRSVLENRLCRLEELWSDPDLALGRALGLPTHTVAGSTYYRRATLFIDGERVEKVFYPVKRPDRCAEQMVSWLKATGRW
jgi:peroxiredoxin